MNPLACVARVLRGRPDRKTWMILDDWGRQVPNTRAASIECAITAAEVETGHAWRALIASGFRLSWDL